MYLHGSFITKRKETVSVEILTGKDRTLSLEIGGSSGVLFADDPVDITSEVNDTFDPLFRSSASIRLLTRGLVQELFSKSVLDAVVNIRIDGVCVFAGYIVPQTFSQPFSKAYDELELNCVDALSALQYERYGDIGTSGHSYAQARSSADTLTFSRILEGVLSNVTCDLDISGEEAPRIMWDASVTSGEISEDMTIWDDAGISELLFFGETEDEVWSKLSVAEEIMRYLNLHMVQTGMDIRIYSLDTVKSGADIIEWKSLHGDVVELRDVSEITITLQTAMSTDATLSIGEVYNRLELTCDIKEMENLIESPLTEESLKSPYSARQLYMTEYSSDAQYPQNVSVPFFKGLVNGNLLSYGFKCSVTDWYVRVYSSRNWRFPITPGGEDRVEEYCSNNQYQHQLPFSLLTAPGAAILSFGRVKDEFDGKDNSLQSKIDMETSLVISVNGNGKDSASEAYPTDAALLASCPVAEYTGGVSGGTFSPADDESVNYIVFTGRIVLNPLLEQVFAPAEAPWLPGNAGVWPDLGDGGQYSRPYNVPGKGYDKGRLYCTKWYMSSYPGGPSSPVAGPGFMPFTGEVPEQYEFKYSAVGDSTDTISKVGVVACMLVIGDKCVVETGTAGKPSDFTWMPYKERKDCASDDEYYQQSFTLGFDPKIGDKLVGTEFDIQNNIDYSMGLDIEGTAIPIRKSDKISGKVQFRILGPVNVMWDEVTRRHKTWFRSARWSSGSIPLMAHVAGIIIKSFEVKLCSDNGLLGVNDNSDLVYVSDTNESFVNKKDDLKFRFTTALTRDERQKLGLGDSLKLSAPVVISSGDPLLSVCNVITGGEGKPEQLYVDGYYREYHKPRVGLVHKLRSSVKSGWFDTYLHPALPGRRFFAQGVSRGLQEGWTEVTLKEIDEPSNVNGGD